MGPPGPAGSSSGSADRAYFAQQTPSQAVSSSAWFVDVPGASFSFVTEEAQQARFLVTAQLSVWRPGGGPVTCGLWLGGEAPHVLEQVTLEAPADGRASEPFYFSVMRGRSAAAGTHAVQLQVALDVAAQGAGCRVEGAAVEVVLR
jgi:hypothetical protein